MTVVWSTLNGGRIKVVVPYLKDCKNNEKKRKINKNVSVYRELFSERR
jgi:hypothetical protein